jgi:hypothetical protein
MASQQEQLDEINKKLDMLIKDSRSDKVYNVIQTLAVVLTFFLGVATIHDALKKLK